MIIQALKEYYDRKSADPESRIAPPGFEWKEIPFVIVLSLEGLPVALNDTTEIKGKVRRIKTFLVPQTVKRSVGIASNLLWDNPEYALGIVLKGKPDRVRELHAAFKKRIEDLGEISDSGILAVKKFLDIPDKAKCLEIFGEPFQNLLESGGNVSFKLAAETCLVTENVSIMSALRTVDSEGAHGKALCMISGEMDCTERLHAAIKGVWGAQSSGANIVSFNQDAFKSFGKEQGSNAPIGQSVAFSYTTALNHLLSKDSKQRMQIGDSSTVFWAERDSSLEHNLVDFFGEPPKDDPDRNVRAVESLYKAVHNGTYSSDDAITRFYVLGLAPNASRIAIRFWIVDTVPKISEKICQHFQDIRIVHGPRDQDAISLFRLLVSTAVLGKSENIPPNIAGETMRAILAGLPYPQTLLQAVIRRIRSEREITHPRASIIKAFLNRSLRLNNPEKLEEMKVSLDIHNSNTGYRLGRLFATLEKIQQEASPGINATIRDKFYGAASSTPVTVFGNLLRLKNHHLAKLESAGRRVQFEKLLGEIMSGIADFSPHLRLEDQGRFAIGYYHQMQDFFTKKNDNPQTKGN